MIVLVFIAVVLTLLAIACHIESLNMHKDYHLYTQVQLLLSRILVIALYSINVIIILILIYKVLSL